MPINPQSWAANFTSELVVGDEHVPLDRIVARHANALAELRKLGMTWRGIAQLLVRAGARRADGNPISSDQLRVGYARVGQKKAEEQAKRPAKPRPVKTAEHAPPLAASDVSAPLATDAVIPEANGAHDVSGNEIEAALARLSKIGPTGVKK